MNINIITPEEELYNGEIISIKLPGINGQFQNLNNHAPIVSALTEGEVELEDYQNKKVRFQIKKGFVEVLHNNISLLVQGAHKI